MASDVVATVGDLPLVERIQAAQLPPPEECLAIRKRAGATQRDIATEVGVSASAVHRWEKGARVRRHHAIAYRRILDALRDAA